MLNCSFILNVQVHSLYSVHVQVFHYTVYMYTDAIVTSSDKTLRLILQKTLRFFDLYRK